MTPPPEHQAEVGRRAAPDADIVDTTWHLIRGIGRDGDIAILSGFPVTLFMQEGRLGGVAACNHYGGDYELGADGSFSTPNTWTTDAGCGPAEVMEAERRFLSAFGDVERWELLDGGATLRLSGTGLRASELIFISDRPAADFGTPVPTFDHRGVGPGDKASAPREGAGLAVVTVADAFETAATDPRAADPFTITGGFVFASGGTWTLCERIEFEDRPRCRPRWLIITNFDAELLEIDPAMSRREFSLDLADGADHLTSNGDVVWSPEPVDLEVRFIDDGRVALAAAPDDSDLTERDEAVLEQLHRFAQDPSSHPLPATRPDGVELWLGMETHLTRSGPELRDPDSWVFDVAGGFGGFVGPFSALDPLSNPDTPVILTAGRHNHCAGNPRAIPEHLDRRRQLSIQPSGTDSCIDWFSVDVFVDDAGLIVAINVDYFGP